MDPNKDILMQSSLKSSVVKMLYVCLATVVLFNLVTITEGRKRCSMITEFTTFDPDNPNTMESCRKCPKCPIGYGLPVQCGLRIPISTSTDCIPCAPNTYSNTDDSTACRPCHECHRKKVLKQCTTTQNRVCDTTCLDPHHYFDLEDDECRECYFCCDDVSESDRLQQCKDIGMPHNRQCKKTRKNEQCKLAIALVLKTTTTKPEVGTVPTITEQLTITDNSFSTDSRSPNKTPPAPIDQRSKDKGIRNVSQPADKDYKGYYIGGAVLGGVFLTFITVKFHNRRRSHLEGGNRADGERQDDEHEMSVLVQNPDNSTNPSNDVKLDKFPYHVEDFILTLDDESTAVVKTWRHVACKFEVSKLHIQVIQQEYRKPGGSPTRALMDKLCTQNVSLKRFVDVLRELERHDVAGDILNWYSKQLL